MRLGWSSVWAAAGRSLWLTILLSSCADCFEIWEPHSPRTLRACPGLYMDCFIFLLHFKEIYHYNTVIPRLTSDPANEVFG